MKDPNPPRAERAAVVCLGLGLTVLVHVLMISPLFLGLGARARTLTETEGGETSGAPVAMTVISLEEDPATSDSDAPPQKALSDLVLPARIVAPVGSIHIGANAVPVIIDPAEATSSAEQSVSTDSARALTFGRYLEQVVARVERAWLRPRSPIGASDFACLVQVDQDSDRNVKEITLKACNGTTQWQLSLVHAIESASPFPVPPDPAVFSPTLTFEMTAAEFKPGAPSERYEVSH